MIDQKTLDELAEIKRLLAEAYEHYFTYGDGHAKSSEGSMALYVTEPYYWREDEPKRPGLSLYSYIFGEGRQKHYENTTDALSDVREWHAEEMATRYCGTCQSVFEKDWCDSLHDGVPVG